MAFLELSGIRKAFGPTVAVRDFNLNVDPGEFVSFLGTSGCGKTTTLRMIAGFEIPTAGSIRIAGADVTNVPPNKRNVGMVFQSYALFPHMTVADNIAFGLKIAKQSRDIQVSRVGEMLELIGLPQMGARYPHQLSGGQQQRVALARALAPKPNLLLLDEPLSALDAKIRVSLRTELREIQRKLGITSVYVTHDQEEALSMSDRVVVMNAGAIEQIGTPFEIYNTPATEFVASFVGTLNRLPGVVKSADVIEAAGGAIRVEQSTAATIGSMVMLTLRPESLKLGAGQPGDNVLSAKLVGVEFLGSVVRCEVEIAGAHRLEADLLNSPDLRLPDTGAAIQVHFAPAAVRVMPAA